MSENLDNLNNMPEEMSEGEVVYVDEAGMVHKFKSSEEKMQWLEERNQDRNNP